MKNLYKCLHVFLFLLFVEVANAQFDIYLPSEKRIVTAESFDDWIALRDEYSGYYEYYNDGEQNSQRIYNGKVKIFKRGEDYFVEWDERFESGEDFKNTEIVSIDDGNFSTVSKSGSFKRLLFYGEGGKLSVSYQMRVDGDCCDGACDKLFERVTTSQENE
jgi:uncharacterized beta-barrel protein YwiB (DUF1934 family)